MVRIIYNKFTDCTLSQIFEISPTLMVGFVLRKEKVCQAEITEKDYGIERPGWVTCCAAEIEPCQTERAPGVGAWRSQIRDMVHTVRRPL